MPIIKYILILFLMCSILPAIAGVLKASCSNTYGRIGVVVSSGARIYCVHKESPAMKAGLKEGDVILSADYIKGKDNVDGEIMSVHLVIQRNKDIFEIDIPRTEPRNIKK